MKAGNQVATFLLLGTFIASLRISDGRQDYKNSKNIKCFMCHTLSDREDCQHVSRLDNETQVCGRSTEGFCMVRSFAYSVNGTDLKVWMMERKCSDSCINECVITGDRNKLHLCTSCCQEHLCNVGNGALTLHFHAYSLDYAYIFYINLCSAIFLLNNL